MKKCILTFDLEFWYNSKLLEKYMPPKPEKDLVEESVYPLLNLLKKNKIRATFFVLGKLAEKYPEIIKRIDMEGHEIASHGYSHTPINELSLKEFEEEIVKTDKIIKKITGKKPIGFRAPDFSIRLKDKEIFKILKRNGYIYDSSIFPFKNFLYGEKEYLKESFSIEGIEEIPLAVYQGRLVKVPIAGGFYFRAIPLSVFAHFLNKHAKKTIPALYFHPHELYSFIPDINAPYLKKKLKYLGVKKSFKKFEKFVEKFDFVSVQDFLEIKKFKKFDLHCHTKYSQDSFMNPLEIIKIAKKRGLDGIAITDHDTFRGVEETLNRNKDKDFFVIPGEEIKTEKGDVIGLFLKKEISSRKFNEVIKEIRSQRGIILIPHPVSRSSRFSEEDLRKADVIEVLNSRQRKDSNKKAMQIALKLGKPVSAGSDSHNYLYIGSSYVKLKGDDLEEIKKSLLRNKEVYGKRNNYYISHARSVLNEIMKGRK